MRYINVVPHRPCGPTKDCISRRKDKCALAKRSKRTDYCNFKFFLLVCSQWYLVVVKYFSWFFRLNATFGVIFITSFSSATAIIKLLPFGIMMLTAACMLGLDCLFYCWEHSICVSKGHAIVFCFLEFWILFWQKLLFREIIFLETGSWTCFLAGIIVGVARR